LNDNERKNNNNFSLKLIFYGYSGLSVSYAGIHVEIFRLILYFFVLQ